MGGLLAEIIRLELAAPGRQLVDASTYDQLFTVHGTLMLLFFAGPLAIGFANAIVPLQIGAADMAFPRLNALSFWLFLFGGLIVMAGFLTSGGAAAAGWTGYVPLSNALYSPQAGMDLWIVGVALVGFSGIFGALNLMVTIYGRRAPGHAHVPDADVHLDDARDLRPDPVRVPVDHRGAGDAAVRSAPGRRVLRPDARAAPRSCGSTCSGSSATPRSTSSCCRTSGS